jgi:phage terminase small subunit
LSQEATAWWKTTVESFELDAHHMRLLRLACEAWDRSQQAREIIARDGLTYNDRFGAPRARPEVAIERDSRLAFARLLREIGLDVAEPEAPRPNALRHNAR